MLIVTNPNFRTNIQTHIQSAFFSTATAAAKFAKNVEIGIYNYSIQEAKKKKIVKKWNNPHFVLIYKTHLKSVLANLKSNGALLEDILSEKMRPEHIAFMNHQEMAPEKWSRLIAEKTERDKHKFEQNVEASTTMFTCRKCRGNQCTYYMMQIRSADEPMHCFITCTICGHRWKEC